MTFANWINTFTAEKGIDAEKLLEIEGPSGLNMIPVGCLIEAMIAAPATEQAKIKHAIVRLDFSNAPILPFFTHLARAIAI